MCITKYEKGPGPKSGAFLVFCEVVSVSLDIFEQDIKSVD